MADMPEINLFEKYPDGAKHPYDARPGDHVRESEDATARLVLGREHLDDGSIRLHLKHGETITMPPYVRRGGA